MASADGGEHGAALCSKTVGADAVGSTVGKQDVPKTVGTSVRAGGAPKTVGETTAKHADVLGVDGECDNNGDVGLTRATGPEKVVEGTPDSKSGVSTCAGAIIARQECKEPMRSRTNRLPSKEVSTRD